MTCASTRARSEPDLRADAVLFAFIGFSHAEDVAIRATRRIPDHYQAALQKTVTNDAYFAIVFAQVFYFKSEAVENIPRIFEIQTSFN